MYVCTYYVCLYVLIYVCTYYVCLYILICMSVRTTMYVCTYIQPLREQSNTMHHTAAQNIAEGSYIRPGRRPRNGLQHVLNQKLPVDLHNLCHCREGGGGSDEGKKERRRSHHCGVLGQLEGGQTWRSKVKCHGRAWCVCVCIHTQVKEIAHDSLVHSQQQTRVYLQGLEKCIYRN